MEPDLTLDEHDTESLLGIVAIEERTLPVRAMEALLRRGGETLDFLAECMEEGPGEQFGNPVWPVVLVAEMGRALPDPTPAARALAFPLRRHGLRDPESYDFWVAIAAAEGLARIGDPAIPVLEELLDECEVPVRLGCYAALGAIGTDRALDRLLRAAEEDLAVADVVAQALRETGRKEAVEPLHRLLSRCPEHHRIDVEDAIRSLHHGAVDEPPVRQDWRLRFRPRGRFVPFDPGWVGFSAMIREHEELIARRPTLPVRPLEEILAEEPEPRPNPDEQPCALCARAGRVRYGLPSCKPSHTARLAALQRELLEEWAEEGFDDLFPVLGEVEQDAIWLENALRERGAGGPWDGGPLGAEDEAEDDTREPEDNAWDPEDDTWDLADDPEDRSLEWDDDPWDPEDEPWDLEDMSEEDQVLDDWLARTTMVRLTARWFLERGVEDLGAALEELARKSRGYGPSRPSEEGPGRPPPPSPEPAVGRNDPCPCGSGRKYKKCCGDPRRARAAEAGAPSPIRQVVSAEGDPLLFGRAHYRVLDAAGVARALEASGHFGKSTEEGEFTWTEPGDGVLAALPGSRRVLGTVALGEDDLTLECVSRERLERGRALLEELAGDALEHRADTLQDPSQVARGSARRPRPRTDDEEDEIPLEVRREITQKFKDGHYRRWIDEPVPALGGLTPREAMETIAGERALRDLLLEFEENERRAAEVEGFAYDFSWLWDELMLDRPEGGGGAEG